MITKRDVRTVQEQIQEDLLCLLDGLPDLTQQQACQIVVDRMKPLKQKEVDCENSQLCDTVLQLAKNDGAEYPTIGESSDGNAIVVDADSGRVWEVQLRELK